MKKKTTYYGDEFTVDSETLDIQMKDQKIRKWFNQEQKRHYVSYKGNDGKHHLVTRARIICQAFHPNKNYRDLQTDHIDSDQSNDDPSNLRWVTRKQNNSTEHSKKMRSMNHKSHKHRDEVIEAVNEDTGEVRHFANGKQCAEAIGCSSPVVYMTLDRARENKKATVKGWILKWTKDFKEDELKSLKHERNIVVRTLRNGKTSERIKRLESIIDDIDKSIERRKKRADKMNKHSKIRETTVMFIDHLRQKKKMLESQIEELVALKCKNSKENDNIEQTTKETAE